MGATGATVSKLGLDLCERVTAIKKLCGARAAKHMWMDSLRKVGLLGESLKPVPDVGGKQRGSSILAGSAKERFFVSQPQFLTVQHPCLKIRLNTVRQDREIIYSTFAVSNSHLVLSPVEVSRNKITEFSSSKTSFPEHHDDGFVSRSQSAATTGIQ